MGRIITDKTTYPWQIHIVLIDNGEDGPLVFIMEKQQAKGRGKPHQISNCKNGEAFEHKDCFASACEHPQTIKVIEHT